MNKTDVLERCKQRAKKLRAVEKIEANRLMFERSGFDYDDLERMAAAIDRDVEDLLLLDAGCSFKLKPRRVTGKPGRKESTRDIADFVAVRKETATLNQIYLEWRKTYPNDTRVKKPEDMPLACRRIHGDKAKKPY